MSIGLMVNTLSDSSSQEGLIGYSIGDILGRECFIRGLYKKDRLVFSSI